MCARPHSFPATFAPIFVGTSFSLFYKINFKIDNFILFLVICLLIQSATNLFNEYYDYKRGLDKIDSQGISASILRKKLSEKEVLNFAKLLYIIALFLGIILSLKTSLYLLAIGILSMVFGYIYTGGKYPIAYTPFGEITAGYLWEV
ncbi:1,4-dihydroxy-2-naphthoate octaprenyltransferase domain protein [Gemelliphila asaccharolytica]|uniref:1,4-dihydroxy-2-naphthoate octaprenyltransferase domain protein n=2 Tax=Gemelliphila asaccharolytica TaxID=502393 RepID=A0ABR5TND4_9BACL|nr:1,4-dihydroxy-2-naphthoate octaprenyltransferase domain protein [Gemella asaccharolytica]